MTAALNQEREKKESSWLILIVFSIYVIVNLLFLFTHEPWGDEARHWLIARDLSPIGIIRQMKYEGHLCLWHFILFPFAHLGFPYRILNIISFFITAIAAFLFLKKGPFPVFVKAILIMSPFFTYYLPVISRCYCLISLLIVCLSICYPSRFSKPLLFGLILGLLLQTHVIMAGFVGLSSLLYLFEVMKKRKSLSKKSFFVCLSGLSIPFFSLLFFIMQLFHVKMSSAYNFGIGNGDNFTEAFFAALSNCSGSLFNKDYSILVLFGILLVLFTLLRKKRVEAFWCLLAVSGAILYQILIYVFIYPNYISRDLSIIFMILYFLWTQKEGIRDIIGNRFINVMVIFFCLSSSFYHYPEFIKDINGNFSDSKNAGLFILENIADDELIISNGDYSVTAIAPYIPSYSLWNPVTRKTFTFSRQDSSINENTTYEEMIKWIKKDFPTHKDFYLIYIDYNDNYIVGLNEVLQNYRPIYQTEGNLINNYNEKYKVFHLKTDSSE